MEENNNPWGNLYKDNNTGGEDNTSEPAEVGRELHQTVDEIQDVF